MAYNNSERDNNLLLVSTCGTYVEYVECKLNGKIMP